LSDLRPELERGLERIHAGFRLESLTGDASTRRFHRLYLPEGGTRIVMDYGAPFEGETDDVRLARIFEHAIGRADGSGAAGALYRKAVDLAAEIAIRGTRSLSESSRAEGPALDAERFRFEMRFFTEHFVEGFLGAPAPAPATVRRLEELADEVASHPRVMCHRDFHSRNIMVRGDGSLAMVDIQDARWGPDTYDVASLLRDAYVDLDESDVREAFERYMRLLSGSPDVDKLRDRFHLAATQRMIKALGTFGYQVARLGRERYRDAIPRTLERLDRTLPAHAATRPLHAALTGAAVFG